MYDGILQGAIYLSREAFKKGFKRKFEIKRK